MRRNQTDSFCGPVLVTTGRRDVKASRRPSALNRGAVELNAGFVRRRGGALASAGTAQISLCLRFSVSTTNVRT